MTAGKVDTREDTVADVGSHQLIREYKPQYETEVRRTTRVQHHNTMHVEYVDWQYPFDDPEHTQTWCCSAERKAERVEQLKGWLRVCENFKDGDVYASNYGGWPRIWKQVVCVGMGSAWPYWKPRPIVLVSGTLGVEWYDWTSLTGAESR